MINAYWRDDAELIGVVDTYTSRKCVDYCGHLPTWGGEETVTVYSPNDIKNTEFDHLIIDTVHADEVCQMMADMNIDSQNVICLTKLFKGENKYSVVVKLLDYVRNAEEVVDLLLSHPSVRNIVPMSYDLTEYTLFNDPTTVKQDNLSLVCFTGDYTRVRELELLVKEIKERNLTGAMAEVGVFTGGFSKLLKHYFPEKELYLYDTFSGFDIKDTEEEYKNGSIDQTWSDVFKLTTYEKTKQYIGYESSCHYRVGYFPETVEAEEKELKFSIVSLDADLYNPTLAGLEFFYPRLEEGGYIMIHEYNARLLDSYAIKNDVRELSCFYGIKDAVNEFEKRYGHICKIPITDHNGSLVITK
jgi:hypothetical protein